MNANKILRLASMFYSLAASQAEKLPENSKDLSTILKNLSSLETYHARKKYAEKNLKRLSSGSSRIVYLTPNDTVLKLAKNDKGLAQNKAESNPKMKSKHINKIIKKDKDNLWIEVNKLEKITAKEFKELSGIDFKDFDPAIRYGLRSVSGSKKDKPDNFDEVSKSDIYKEMVELGKKWKLMGGDIARISSWGVKDKTLVLIDAGLTKDVFEEFYESSS